MGKSDKITTLVEYNKIRESINKTPLPELVNHPYVTSQLAIQFGEGKKLKGIINRFKTNYMILITDAKVIKSTQGCDHFKLLQSLINLTKDDLSLNPADEESCIVKYKDEVKGIPMWKGRLKRMMSFGIIEYVERIEVIYASDEFIDKGNSRFIHKKNLQRPVDDKRIGVALEVKMPNGRPRYKIVSAAEIEERRLKSPHKDGAWKDFPDQMWKKTAIIIFENEIGKKAPPGHADDEDRPVGSSFAEGTIILKKEKLSEEEKAEFDDHEVIEDGDQSTGTAEPSMQNARDLPVQDPSLRAKLDGMKGLLPDDKKDKLAGVVNILTDDKINVWINFINSELEKSRKESTTQDPDIKATPSKEATSLKDSPI